MRCEGAIGLLLLLSIQLIAAELQGPLIKPIKTEKPTESNDGKESFDENERTEPIKDREEVAFIDTAGSESMSDDKEAFLFGLMDKVMHINDFSKILNEKKEEMQKAEAEMKEHKLPADDFSEYVEGLGARLSTSWNIIFRKRIYDRDAYDNAVKELEELAKLGYMEANTAMGFFYSVGVGGKNVSQAMALLHFTLAAADAEALSEMALGYRYSYGINVPMNCEKSLSYYIKVARKVAKDIKFSSGPAVHRVRLLDESENPGSQEAEIVDYYQLLADKGDVQSQIGLGQLYYQGGKAIQQNYKKALEYFTQAANSGNAIGYAFLGKLYLEGGEGIKADNEAAFRYFKRAADLGDPVGQSGLGYMYLNGLGVPVDLLKALDYFTQAADQGWVDGQLLLGYMYFSGFGVKLDYKLAFKYFNLASQSGHVLAYYYLGLMHAYGLGMLRSCPAAVEFFKNVAERGPWTSYLMHAYAAYKNHEENQAFMCYALLAEIGYEVAQSNAAFLLDRGDVTIFNDRKEDLLRAFYYWKRAAAQGYSAAQVKLGDYYYYGWGTNVDFETAAALYRKASEQQFNAQAMFNLGYMHEKGLGMEKDWHLAKRLYDLAAEANADAKVPVALALMKLQLLTKFESFKETLSNFISYFDGKIPANWDLYVIPILILVMIVLNYTIRHLENQERALQEEIYRLENEIRAYEADETANPDVINDGDTLDNPSQTHSVQENGDQQNSDSNAVEAVTSSESNQNILRQRKAGNASDQINDRNVSNAAAPVLPSAARSSTADPTD